MKLTEMQECKLREKLLMPIFAAIDDQSVLGFIEKNKATVDLANELTEVIRNYLASIEG